MGWARTALRVWLSLMMVGIALQFFFAAAGAFGATNYDTHRMLGHLLLAAGLLALVLAALARTFVVPVAIGFVLLVVQLALGQSGHAHPWLGALHGLNALAIGAVFGITTGRTHRTGDAAPTGPAN